MTLFDLMDFTKDDIDDDCWTFGLFIDIDHWSWVYVVWLTYIDKMMDLIFDFSLFSIGF